METRKLYLVPIIHTPSDMGSITPILSERSSDVLGKELWAEHQKTISNFWYSLSVFFSSLQIDDLKIYQDGMVAEGEEGLRIVNEGVRLGSVNYQIVSSLIRRGAVLIRTEDATLVQKEYSYIKKLTAAKSTLEKETTALRYRLIQRKLLENRDNFITKMIEGTLKEGDTGVLFIGAYHEVLSKLPTDIHVVQVKEVTKVREYHKLLTNISIKTQREFQQLTEYLVAPILNIQFQ